MTLKPLNSLATGLHLLASFCSPRYAERTNVARAVGLASVIPDATRRQQILTIEEAAGFPLREAETRMKGLQAANGSLASIHKISQMSSNELGLRILAHCHAVAAYPLAERIRYSWRDYGKIAAKLLIASLLVAPPTLVIYYISASLGAMDLPDWLGGASADMQRFIGVVCALLNAALNIQGTQNLTNSYYRALTHSPWQSLKQDLRFPLAYLLCLGAKFLLLGACVGVSGTLIMSAKSNNQAAGVDGPALDFFDYWMLAAQTLFIWNTLGPWIDWLFHKLWLSRHNPAVAEAYRFIDAVEGYTNDPCVLQRKILMLVERDSIDPALHDMLALEMAKQLKVAIYPDFPNQFYLHVLWGLCFIACGCFALATAPDILDMVQSKFLPDWMLDVFPAIRLGDNFSGAFALNGIMWALYHPYMHEGALKHLRNWRRIFINCCTFPAQNSRPLIEGLVALLLNIVAFVSIFTAIQQMVVGAEQDYGDHWLAQILELLNRNYITLVAVTLTAFWVIYWALVIPGQLLNKGLTLFCEIFICMVRIEGNSSYLEARSPYELLAIASQAQTEAREADIVFKTASLFHQHATDDYLLALEQYLARHQGSAETAPLDPRGSARSYGSVNGAPQEDTHGRLYAT